jgi:hypothetical protein
LRSAGRDLGEPGAGDGMSVGQQDPLGLGAVDRGMVVDPEGLVRLQAGEGRSC